MNNKNDTYVLLERSDLGEIGDVISVLREMIEEIKGDFKSKIIAILHFYEDENQDYFVVSCKDFNRFLREGGINTATKKNFCP